MFKDLIKLKREMDRSVALSVEEYNKAMEAYLNYGRKYYDDENLTLAELNKLYSIDCEFDGLKVVDYFDNDETMSFLAASVFDDTHFGSAITDAEADYRERLKGEYATEIEFAKVIVANNPNFEALSYEKKINFVANLLAQLHSKKDEDDDMSLNNPDNMSLK